MSNKYFLLVLLTVLTAIGCADNSSTSSGNRKGYEQIDSQLFKNVCKKGDELFALMESNELVYRERVPVFESEIQKLIGTKIEFREQVLEITTRDKYEIISVGTPYNKEHVEEFFRNPGHIRARSADPLHIKYTNHNMYTMFVGHHVSKEYSRTARKGDSIVFGGVVEAVKYDDRPTGYRVPWYEIVLTMKEIKVFE